MKNVTDVGGLLRNIKPGLHFFIFYFSKTSNVYCMFRLCCFTTYFWFFSGRMALDGIRMPDGCYADGTWELKMHVTDLHRDVSLRVTGEIHIGGVMLKLVEKLGTCTFCYLFAENCTKSVSCDVCMIT